MLGNIQITWIYMAIALCDNVHNIVTFTWDKILMFDGKIANKMQSKYLR